MNPSSWSYLHLSNSQLGPLFHRSIHWPNWAAVAAGLQSKLSKQRPEGENDTERAAGRPGDASDRDDPGLSRGWLNSAFLTFLDDRKLLRLASWVTIYIYNRLNFHSECCCSPGFRGPWIFGYFASSQPWGWLTKTGWCLWNTIQNLGRRCATWSLFVLSFHFC
jgi:hypothetical protein